MRVLYTLLSVSFLYIQVSRAEIVPLDLAAKIDETAAFLNASMWGHLDFPAPFGRKEFPEEAYIRDLDSNIRKLGLLNAVNRSSSIVPKHDDDSECEDGTTSLGAKSDASSTGGAFDTGVARTAEGSALRAPQFALRHRADADAGTSGMQQSGG